MLCVYTEFRNIQQKRKNTHKEHDDQVSDVRGIDSKIFISASFSILLYKTKLFSTLFFFLYFLQHWDSVAVLCELRALLYFFNVSAHFVFIYYGWHDDKYM